MVRFVYIPFNIVKPKYKKFTKDWSKDFRPLEDCIVLCLITTRLALRVCFSL